MNERTRLIAATISGAIAGGALIVLIAFAAIAILPDDGFADLGVAAFAKVIGIPAGAVVGAIVGFTMGRRRQRTVKA